MTILRANYYAYKGKSGKQFAEVTIHEIDTQINEDMKKFYANMSVMAILAVTPVIANGQRTLTLDECRQMAVENNKDLKQAETKMVMSGYDKKIALANYFPNISAQGAYAYNSSDVALISDETSGRLKNLGTTVNSAAQSFQQSLMNAITSNPKALAEYLKSPMWQTVTGALSQLDLSEGINAIGEAIDKELHPDMHNLFIGAVSVRQPVFMGGKIVAANKIARLAEELSKTEYDQRYQEVVLGVDEAYWQIVSIANKKKLSEAYADLLHKMEHDVEVTVAEGVATESDKLQIKVKANEADMLLTKATNGLVLSKMLLCKEIGLPLDTEISLVDETVEAIPMVELSQAKDMEQIYADRPEIRSLSLATQIYDKKVDVARADMMPQVAVFADYVMTNPNVSNGFRTSWSGMFNAGVMVNVPIFHAFEAQSKTRKAKAEATIYQTRLDDAKNLINLQVTQLRERESEAFEKFSMAESNLANAEENLRTATIGFEEGVIATNTALAAQTAWLQAHSEYIDAGIELQVLAANINKAEGNIKSNRQ